jgi:hypothetical protein
MNVNDPAAGSMTSTNVATPATSNIFRTIPEALFATQPIKVDADSITRDVHRVSAQSGTGYGSQAAPINGNRLRFEFIRQSGYIDLHNSYFLIGVQFRAAAGTAALLSPDPFAIGAAFSEIRISVNQANNEIFRTTIGDTYPIFVANLLTNYTRKELNKHPSLFLPFDALSDQLTMGNNGGGVFVSAAQRVANYCTGLQNKMHVIPLCICDIMPRIEKQVLSNIGMLSIELVINPFVSGALTATGTRMLYPFSTASNANVATDRSCITMCELYVSTYKTPIERPIGGVEFMGYIYPLMYRRTLMAGTAEITIPNVRNLQSLIMFRPTALNAWSATYRVNLDDVPNATLAAISNFVLFDTGGLAGTTSIYTADLTGQTNYPVQGFNLRYGSFEYPQQNINLTTATTQDVPSFEILYKEYCTCCGRFGTPLAPALSPEEFRMKMPMIAISLKSKSDFPSRNPPADLSLRFSGVQRQQEIFIILNTLRAMEIDAHGNVRIQE